MNVKHCMLDLETLGTGRGAQIVSVGAVTFDSDGLDTESTFYRRIKLPERVIVEVDTLAWWAKQNEAARVELFAEPRCSLNDACVEFTRWWTTSGCRYVWSHGATFDVPMLEQHFPWYTDPFTLRREGGPPWKYGDVRDTRTLYQLAGLDLKAFRGVHSAYAAVDVKHNAVHDAVAQALAAYHAIRQLNAWDSLSR